MMDYGTYRAGLDLISGNFASVIGHLLQMFYGTDKGTPARQQFVRAAYPIVEAYRQQNYAQGVKLIHSEAKRTGVDLATLDIPDIADYNPAVLDITINSLTGGANNAPYKDTLATLVSHVEQPARQVMIDLADPAPADEPPTPDGPQQPVLTKKKRRSRANQGTVLFARVLTGNDNCAFCVMVASRGAVYASKRAAGDTNFAADKYHTGCDCIAVPVLANDFPAQDTADGLFKLWVAAEKKYPTDGTSNDALNSLRQYITKHPEKLAAAVPDLSSHFALAA